MAKGISGGTFLSKYLSVLPVVGVTLLLVLGIAAYQAVTRADEHDVLQGLSVTPDTVEALTIPPGGRVRLTAIGHYATMDMPVPARWDFEPYGNFVPGSFVGDCDGKTRCTVEAGEEGGEIGVRVRLADVEGPGILVFVHVARQNPFTDELPDWAFDAIIALQDLGIIRGYDDGRYGAADPVTRGQVITLLYRTLRHASFVDEPQDCTQEYTDVPLDHYAFTPACLFRTRGWSTAEATLDLDSSAPREVTATFVNSVFGPTLLEAQGVSEADLTQGQVFTDIPVDDPFYTATRNLNSLAIMTGFPNGEFGKGETLNRAQVAVVIYRILQAIDDYHIEALVHEAGGSEEGQEEVEGVDLTVTDFTISQEHPTPGEVTTFSYTITNIGNTDAPAGNARTRILINASEVNRSWNWTNQPLAPAIPAGHTVTGGGASDFPVGTYRIEICADGLGPEGGFIEESNEENNCLEETFTMGGAPQADLTISDITVLPTSPTTNDAITVRYTITNAGNADSPAGTPGRTRITIDPTQSSAAFTYQPIIPAILAGQSVIEEHTFTTLSAGTHLTRVCADSMGPQLTSLIEETNESNNCSEETFTVGQTSPLQANSTACTSNSQCNSGFCTDGVCCNTACTGTCQACSPSTGTCTNIPIGQDPANECSGLCSGNGTCGGSAPNGFACQTNAQCASGNCIDGFCCNTTCTGLCVKCNTPGSFGTCINVVDGLDPVNECPGSQVCNGAGACRAP